MSEPVIAVFDIGKTNKKILLFSSSLELISEREEKFPVVKDEDGFECDDIVRIESWIRSEVKALAASGELDLAAINFATYGATLVYIDSQGKRLTPVYNYLKPVDPEIPARLYERYGGEGEFARATASPPLGMLNSGIQALWLKNKHPEIFSRVESVLHFPQYLSFLLTGKRYSEHTSIGCHTSLWNFDSFGYHQWVQDEKLPLPEPVSVKDLTAVDVNGKRVKVGTGLHDSSASLAPYFSASKEKFILLSTGTWCITMNPFNDEILTQEELGRDCLCYISTEGKPVKSSRLFLGHFHDVAVKRLSGYYKIHEESFRLIKPDLRILSKLQGKFTDEKIFLVENEKTGKLKEDPELFLFDNFLEAYHRLMIELSDLAVDAVRLVIPEKDETTRIYVTGGFSRSPLFLKLIASSFPDKQVFTSEISNATALGTAAITSLALWPDKELNIPLGLNEIKL